MTITNEFIFLEEIHKLMPMSVKIMNNILIEIVPKKRDVNSFFSINIGLLNTKNINMMRNKPGILIRNKINNCIKVMLLIIFEFFFPSKGHVRKEMGSPWFFGSVIF